MLTLPRTGTPRWTRRPQHCPVITQAGGVSGESPQSSIFLIFINISARRPALTKAALLRFNSGDKKADDVEKKRINNEFGSANNNNSNNNYSNYSNSGNNTRNNNFDYLRTKSVTPSSQLMTRSAYDYKSSYARRDGRKAGTPQMSRRSSSRSGNLGGRDLASPYSWNSFKPVSSFNMMTSARAEPDGIENDDDMKRKDSLEGEYDHSKEYDPFQVMPDPLVFRLHRIESSRILFTTSSFCLAETPCVC